MAGCECCDNFSMIDGGDEFKAFPGLKGDDGTTYYPHVSSNGVISWTNDGGKTNPDPVDISGPPGRSVEMRGPVASVSDLPTTADSDELWLVGAASPYDGWFYNGASWQNLGQIAVGPPGPQGEQGEQGFSPTVSLQEYSYGCLITVTNASGSESALVRNGSTGPIGPAGPGVPTGGSTMDFLRKSSDADYDAQWVPLYSSETPLMDSESGDPGLSSLLSRRDHRHPTDTNRASKTAVWQAAVTTISANGTSSNTLAGLTASHVVGNWGMFSDAACTTPIPENVPPCDITITTAADSWSVTIANFRSTFYLRPTFILKQN